MVEQVTAYKASTGLVHDTAEAAYRDEAHTGFRVLWQALRPEHTDTPGAFADWCTLYAESLHVASSAACMSMIKPKE